MLVLNLIVQITLGISIAVAIVTLSQLDDMVHNVVEFHMDDSFLVVISSGGYAATNHVAAVYVDPYNQQMQDMNATLVPEEIYKMVTIARVLELGCIGFLVQTETPGRQLRLMEETFVHLNDRIQRRFIFLPTIARVTRGSIGVQDEVLNSNHLDFESVLREKSLQYIPDVIIAIPYNEDDNVVIVTHRFTGPEASCRREMLLDTYHVAQKRFNLRATLFPDKVRNLEGKIPKGAIFHYPPFVVIYGDNIINDSNTQIDGMEWRFAVEFAKLYN